MITYTVHPQFTFIQTKFLKFLYRITIIYNAKLPIHPGGPYISILNEYGSVVSVLQYTVSVLPILVPEIHFLVKYIDKFW